MKPAAVLPAAMASEVVIAPDVVTLTRNAAAKIAGHTPCPSNRNAASAMPAGGHTGLALACRNAKCWSAILPATK